MSERMSAEELERVEQDIHTPQVPDYQSTLRRICAYARAADEALGLLITHATDSLGAECDVIRTARAARLARTEKEGE